jgi:hypothetical protein
MNEVRNEEGLFWRICVILAIVTDGGCATR